jgi:pyruvate dehydrogenase E2 component (dihydrolipoamide acetyltransferase)
MAEVIKMPKLSDTMEEGVVAEWHKKVGDTVEAGELLAEIETDKATMEFESFYDGILLHIGVEKGKGAPVNNVLAVIGKKGEDIKKLLADAEKEQQPKEEVEEIKEVVKTEAPKQEVVKTQAPQQVAIQITNTDTDLEIKASPLARNLAKEKGLNLSLVKGTGEGGRIVKRDVENFKGGNSSSFIGVESYSETPVSQMRKSIAKSLSASKFTAPHFYLTVSIDMDNAINIRKAINTSIAPKKVSFNDLVIKSAAASLKKHPAVNSAWNESVIRTNNHVNIGVAVAVDEGLLVPVVRFADGKTLTQISGEVREYAQRAKAKKLQPQDWEGSTFTISNLGMFGIEEFTAIINTPNACILAIGGISEVPVVKNGQIVPGNVMKVTLSCDHRVVDGAVGSAFLNTFKNYMENPVLMLGEYNI